jgi:hypothetical protein
MAEVAGVVASIVQLIDIGGRVVIKLSRFCSDLQKVPHKIKRAKHQVDQLLSLLRCINSDLTASDQGDASSLAGLRSPNHLHFATHLVEDALHQAEELANILDDLAPRKDSLFNRGWRALVSLKKEEDIVERCSRLETLKSDLQMWYGHQSMVLLNKQMCVAIYFQAATRTDNQLVSKFMRWKPQ